MSLLEQAKKGKPKTAYQRNQSLTDEEVELILGYIRGEIRLRQVQEFSERDNPPQAYMFIVAGLKIAWDKGLLKKI